MKMGYHKMVYSHSPGACHLVPGMVNGSEDIHKLSNGLAIISSGIKQGPAHIGREGVLYLFDFNNPNDGVTRLAFTGVTLELPHGLSAWEEHDSDEVIVFVIDHLSERECVHKFKFNKVSRMITYMKSIIDETFIVLNGILATGPDSFYVTNSFGSRRKSIIIIELILLLHRGNVAYYNGQTGHIVADNLSVANGINMSPDGRPGNKPFLGLMILITAELYCTMDEAIHIFHRMPENKLLWKETFMLHTFPDNIQVDKDTGDVWIAAVPIIHQAIAHGEDPHNQAPSQVLRLKMKGGNVESMEEVFVDEGKQLFSSSVAAPHKDAMLIGTVFQNLMYCKIEYLD